MQAKPQRKPKGRPAFANKCYAEILSVLRAAGPRGVHRIFWLDPNSPNYMSQVGARITELNRDYGYGIESVDLPESEWKAGIRTKYVLRSEPIETQAFNDSRDWYEQKFGPRPSAKPRSQVFDLPLFSTSTSTTS